MVQIDSKKCVGCGLCAADCISLNIQVEAGKANVQDACFLCGHCVAICPKNAVSIPEYDMEDVENYEEGKFTLEADQFLRSIKFRRSIRDFKPQIVEQEVLERLLQAGRYTATAKNSQNCCFVFVQEKRMCAGDNFEMQPNVLRRKVFIDFSATLLDNDIVSMADYNLSVCG